MEIKELSASLQDYLEAIYQICRQRQLAQANQILVRNVDLGPWIHTKSEVQNFLSPHAGEKLSIRGFVMNSFEKRGNDLVDLDLAIFDSKERGIARVKHSAIIRLRPQD